MKDMRIIPSIPRTLEGFLEHLHEGIHAPSGKTCRRLLGSVAALVLSVSLAGAPVSVFAESDYELILTGDGLEDYYGETEANKKQTIQTNKVPSWPQGPAVGAASAIVMDADSGAVLYGKNQNMRLYPASITKVMTALLTYENLNTSDTITFTENAVFGIESGSSNIGMDVGESITVDQALNGLMIASANEVAIALGEKVSGSEEAFIDLMNERAAELGCTSTHFVNANGLHDEDHYSSTYDMALIAREVFKHPELVEYMSKNNYHFEASEKQPDDFWLGNTNDFLNGAIPCEDVIGGKTGYTDQARETLVTFAARGDMHLICVIMREEPPYQYYDTIDLLDYAFDNFQKVSISENEDRFTLKSADFLSAGEDIFGNSSPYYSISEDASLMIPKDASFADLTASIEPLSAPAGQAGEDQTESAAAAGTGDKAESPEDETGTSPGTAGKQSPSFEENGNRILGVVRYQYNDYTIGTTNVLFTPTVRSSSSADTAGKSSAADAEDSQTESSAGGSSGESTASADVDLPSGSTKTAGNPVVPEEVHGIRAFAFRLVHTGAHGSVYLNILFLIPLLLAVTFILCIIFFIHSYFAELERRRRVRTRRARREQQRRSRNDRNR